MLPICEPYLDSKKLELRTVSTEDTDLGVNSMIDGN